MILQARASKVLAALLLGLVIAAPDVGAVPPAKISKASVGHAAAQSFSKSVTDILGSDVAATEGLARMVAYAAQQGAHQKDVIRSLGRAVTKLEREVGRAKAREFLADFKVIADWADAQPAVRTAELQNLLRDFTRTRSRTFTGAYYELHLAAHFIKNPPPQLQRMQPKTGGDNYLFRDFVVRLPNGNLAYVEAKNWQYIYNKTAVRNLRRQVRSHFRRLRQPPPEEVLNIPPGKALAFYFNTRARGPSVPLAWAQAIEDEARRTLRKPPPKGYGFSEANARRWVQENLSIEEVVFAKP